MEANIARLESEIQYLKGLLDENGIAYDYDAYADAIRRDTPVEIEFPALTVEHAIRGQAYIRVVPADCWQRTAEHADCG